MHCRQSWTSFFLAKEKRSCLDEHRLLFLLRRSPFQQDRLPLCCIRVLVSVLEAREIGLIESNDEKFNYRWHRHWPNVERFSRRVFDLSCTDWRPLKFKINARLGQKKASKWVPASCGSSGSGVANNACKLSSTVRIVIAAALHE